MDSNHIQPFCYGKQVHTHTNQTGRYCELVASLKRRLTIALQQYIQLADWLTMTSTHCGRTPHRACADFANRGWVYRKSVSSDCTAPSLETTALRIPFASLGCAIDPTTGTCVQITAWLYPSSPHRQHVISLRSRGPLPTPYWWTALGDTLIGIPSIDPATLDWSGSLVLCVQY